MEITKQMPQLQACLPLLVELFALFLSKGKTLQRETWCLGWGWISPPILYNCELNAGMNALVTSH